MMSIRTGITLVAPKIVCLMGLPTTNWKCTLFCIHSMHWKGTLEFYIGCQFIFRAIDGWVSLEGNSEMHILEWSQNPRHRFKEGLSVLTLWNNFRWDGSSVYRNFSSFSVRIDGWVALEGVLNAHSWVATKSMAWSTQGFFPVLGSFVSFNPLEQFTSANKIVVSCASRI